MRGITVADRDDLVLLAAEGAGFDLRVALSFGRLVPAKMFVTTESEGLWRTTNLSASTPTFTVDADYPFLHPLRVFFNPYVPGEVWVASFGGGMRVRQY